MMDDALLLSCLHYQLDPQPSNLPDAAALGDWQGLLRSAQNQRALGALCFVEKSNPGFWPEAFRQALNTTRYSLLIHAESAVRRVQTVLHALAQAGIPFIVLKGWEYIHTVYAGDYSLRPCGDIDILVHPAHMRAAEAVLAQTGCLPTLELWPGFRYRYHNVAHHYEIKPDDRSSFDFGVDLHWGLFNRVPVDRLVAVDALFERAAPLAIGAVAALRLSPEDHVLHASGHLTLHHGASPELFRFFELAWVIRYAQPALDWPLLLARASQWKLQLPLQAVLAETERLFPGTLPAAAREALERLQPTAQERHVYRLLMKYRSTPFVHVLPWRWTPAAVWESLRFLFEAFVPGPHFMQSRYGHIRFWPLHYLRRAGNSIKQLLAFSRRS